MLVVGMLDTTFGAWSRGCKLPHLCWSGSSPKQARLPLFRSGESSTRSVEIVRVSIVVSLLWSCVLGMGGRGPVEFVYWWSRPCLYRV